MRTIKLALTAVGLCALVGASTNAHAKLGGFNSPSSYRGTTYRSATTQRTGSLTARTSSPGKSAPSKLNAAKTTINGAKTKLASLTKSVKLGAQGKLGNARANIDDGTLLTVGGVSLMVAGAAAGFITGNAGAAVAAVAGGGIMTFFGELARH